jgi:hypothetical protein
MFFQSGEARRQAFNKAFSIFTELLIDADLPLLQNLFPTLCLIILIALFLIVVTDHPVDAESVGQHAEV